MSGKQAKNRRKPAVSPVNGQPVPVEHQFQPGQSGNPNGRPKGTTLTDTLRKVIKEAEEKGNDIPKALMEAGLKAALKGDYRFWQHLYERLDGKVPDRIAGPDGEKLQIIFKGFDKEPTPDGDD